MLHFQWEVYIQNDTLGNWGQSFYHSLRWMCPTAYGWEADLINGGRGVKGRTTTTNLCNSNHVQEAIWKSSNPNARVDIQCTYSTNGSHTQVGSSALKVAASYATGIW